jgi:prepilin-type processing-associated H-X9-DG protein
MNNAGDPARFFKKESAVQYTAQTPVVMDCIWVDVGPYATDPAGVGGVADLYAGMFSTTGNGQPVGRLLINRHGGRAPAGVGKASTFKRLPGGINMGLADGHVEHVSLDTLWGYYWHKNYQPPPIRPP